MEEQTQSAPTLCRLGCGFFGTSATEGMCSKCFRDYQLRKQQQAATSSPSSASATSSSAANQQHNDSLNQSSASASLPASEAVEERDFSEACVRIMGGGIQATPLSDLPASSQSTPTLEEKGTSPAPGDASPGGASAKSPKKNRCAMCRKKVGLTGFYCRCGEQFCSLHRYADKHNCSFDYKTSGREELQRKHPKVVASKVQKL